MKPQRRHPFNANRVFQAMSLSRMSEEELSVIPHLASRLVVRKGEHARAVAAGDPKAGPAPTLALTYIEESTLLKVAAYMAKDDGKDGSMTLKDTSFPSVEVLAGHNLSEKSVRRAVTGLIDKGFITKSKMQSDYRYAKPGAAFEHNRYHLVPKIWDSVGNLFGDKGEKPSSTTQTSFPPVSAEDIAADEATMSTFDVASSAGLPSPASSAEAEEPEDVKEEEFIDNMVNILKETFPSHASHDNLGLLKGSLRRCVKSVGDVEVCYMALDWMCFKDDAVKIRESVAKSEKLGGYLMKSIPDWVTLYKATTAADDDEEQDEQDEDEVTDPEERVTSLIESLASDFPDHPSLGHEAPLRAALHACIAKLGDGDLCEETITWVSQKVCHFNVHDCPQLSLYRQARESADLGAHLLANIERWLPVFIESEYSRKFDYLCTSPKYEFFFSNYEGAYSASGFVRWVQKNVSHVHLTDVEARTYWVDSFTVVVTVSEQFKVAWLLTRNTGIEVSPGSLRGVVADDARAIVWATKDAAWSKSLKGTDDLTGWHAENMTDLRDSWASANPR